MMYLCSSLQEKLKYTLFHEDSNMKYGSKACFDVQARLVQKVPP